jgi:hypothetical protein
MSASVSSPLLPFKKIRVIQAMSLSAPTFEIETHPTHVVFLSLYTSQLNEKDGRRKYTLFRFLTQVVLSIPHARLFLFSSFVLSKIRFTPHMSPLKRKMLQYLCLNWPAQHRITVSFSASFSANCLLCVKERHYTSPPCPGINHLGKVQSPFLRARYHLSSLFSAQQKTLPQKKR